MKHDETQRHWAEIAGQPKPRKMAAMATGSSSFLAMNAPTTCMWVGHALIVAALFGVGAVNDVHALEVQGLCTPDPALANNSASQPLECIPVNARHQGPSPQSPIDAQKITKPYGSGFEARGLRSVDDRGAGHGNAASSPLVGKSENRLRATTGVAGRPYGGARGGSSGGSRGR